MLMEREESYVMDDSKAITIIGALANGVDPLTGKSFPPDSPYQTPDIVRALYLAAQALDAKVRSTRTKGELPTNAGKPWNEEEDRRLLAQFDNGQSLQDLARAHARTTAGIQARLERHGRLHPPAGQERGRTPGAAGAAPAARGRNTPQ
jgi:hypothetical protein